MTLDLLFDPLYQAPLLGALLISIPASLLGVFLYFRKKLLAPEVLSHAAYPGVVFALFFTWLPPEFAVLVGGALGAYFGAKALSFLEKERGISADSAMALLLAGSLALSILGISILQPIDPTLAKRAEALLYGQMATLRQVHLWIYAAFSLAVVALFAFRYKAWKIVLFDPLYARGLLTSWVFELFIIDLLLVVAVILGMKSVGILLMVGMFIGPAVVGRALSKSFGMLLIIAVLVGVVASFCGACIAIEQGFLPPGPLVVLFLAFFALLALLLAPGRGALWKMIYALNFRMNCQEENLLKALWKAKEDLARHLSFRALASRATLSLTFTAFLLFRAYLKGKVRWSGGWLLTAKGERKGRLLVRHHRLWELYLARSLGLSGALIHDQAETMEHLIDEEMERRLTALLGNPLLDPHKRLIPKERSDG